MIIYTGYTALQFKHKAAGDTTGRTSGALNAIPGKEHAENGEERSQIW